MGQYCTNCGNRIDEGSIFCSSCGNKVQGQNNIVNNVSHNQNDYSNDNPFYENNYSDNRNNSNRNYYNSNRDYNRSYDRRYERNYDRNGNNGFDMGQAENLFMNYFINIFKYKYAMFDGRASRKEYWMFALINFLISLGLCIVEGILGSEGVLFIIYVLGTIIPSIALTVRRLHDIGKGGAMYFVSFIPIVGPIWLIILLCSQGQYGPNQYGDIPRV